MIPSAVLVIITVHSPVGSYEQPGYAGKKLEQTVQAGNGFELEQSVAAAH